MSELFKHDDREYTEDNIVTALHEAGVVAGDSIYVHSALMTFGKLIRGVKRDQFTGAFISALRTVIGDDGHLMMPTFSYSFCNQEMFDVQETPSTVGLLTEAFRKSPGVQRTSEAIFSSAIEGPNSDYFLDVDQSCFGTQSIFEKLYDHDAKFVFLGDTLDLTFIHFVEQRMGVPYRYIKVFPGTIFDNGKQRETEFYFNVRYMDAGIEYDMDGLAGSMRSSGILHSASLGASTVRVVTAKDAFDHIHQGIRSDLAFLLKETPRLPEHTVKRSE